MTSLENGEEQEYRKLSRNEIARESSKLRSWKIAKGRLHREVEFRSFEDAMAFMIRASMEVSKLDHHPEWFNVYNRVEIDLVTHDVNGLSNYDFMLARILDQVISGFRIKKSN